MFSRSFSNVSMCETAAVIRSSAQTALRTAWCLFHLPVFSNFFQASAEAGLGALRLHGDEADARLVRGVDGGVQLVVAVAAEVVAEHDRLDPRRLRRLVEQLGDVAVVAGEAEVPDLPGLLQRATTVTARSSLR